MASFDPNQKVDSGVAPGDMLVAMVAFEAKTSKAGKTYYRCTFQVIYGAQKGKKFFANQSPDTSVSGTAIRLSQWCQAVGQTEIFDPENEREFGQALEGKPFFARIRREVNGQYTNNDVERFLPLPAQAAPIVTEWRREWVEKQAQKSNDDEYEYSDSDFGGRETRGGDAFDSDGFGGSTKGNDFGDPDIPF